MDMELKLLKNLIQLYNPYPTDPDFIYRWIEQMQYFAQDIYEFLIKYLRFDIMIEKKLKIIDAGGGIGAGTEYLRANLYLYYARKYNINIDVSAYCCDLEYRYKEFINYFYPKIEFINKDIFLIDDKYDIVICSHVVEHLKDPVSFINRLNQISNKITCVYAPYNEDISINTTNKQHITSITDALIEKTNPDHVYLIQSRGWNIGKCILAIYCK